MKSLLPSAASILLVAFLGACGTAAPPIAPPPQAEFEALYDYPRPWVERLFWTRHQEVDLLYRLIFSDYQQAWIEQEIPQGVFDQFMELYELYIQLDERLVEEPLDQESSPAQLQWLEERHRLLAQRNEALVLAYRTEAPGAPEAFRRGHEALASRHWELLVLVESLQG
ncbi:MAG: hypothetical protein H0U74_10520 [Bradymonadaceae bacterium]|nr:hypothetical protein [Lujinxingiaceae bacterium]